MQRYEHTIYIQAPPSIVWDIWAKPSSASAWSPTFNAAEPLDADELAVGNRFRLDVRGAGRASRAQWIVTDVQPGCSFAWSMSASGVRATGHHIVTAEPGDASRMQLIVEYSGPMAFLFRPMLARVARRNLPDEAAGLKKCAEAARA